MVRGGRKERLLKLSLNQKKQTKKTSASPKKRKKKKSILRSTLGFMLILLGCGWFLYPNLREWRTQHEVDQIIEDFKKAYPKSTEAETFNKTEEESDSESERNSDVQTQKPQKITAYQDLYQEMQNYNFSLSQDGQNIVDAWSYKQQPFDLKHLNLQGNGAVIGYIQIPDMKVRMPLLLGASSENLEQGAAILSQTSMPIGGENTNCVIAAHRGWKGSAYFQYVENMKPGSRIYITNPWETLIYECTGTKIIYPDDVDSILIQPGKDMVTLFTCHPYTFGGGPYRYLVFCERVKEHTSSSNSHADSSVEDSTNEAFTSTENVSESQKQDYQRTESIIFSDTHEQDLLMIEQILRYILPMLLIAITAIMIFWPTKATKKNSKKRRKKQ